MQRLITSKSRNNFDAQVNSVLLGGATIVPGTLAIGMVAFQKADGTTYLQSRYAAIVELTAEQSEVGQAAIMREPADPASCCEPVNRADDDNGDPAGFVVDRADNNMDPNHYRDTAA